MNGHDLLFGRDIDIAEIQSSLRAERSVYLTGHADVGKSRLLTELAAHGGPAGCSAQSVIHVHGSTAMAQSPLLPLLRLSTRQHEEPTRAILAEVHRRSRNDALWFLVDDAHSLDDESAALIREVASWSQVVVVAAVRSGTSPPEAITSLWREGLAVDHYLAPLDRSASDDLIADLIGRASDEVLVHIWHRSRGHPMSIRELVRCGIDEGALARRNGAWVLRWDPALRGRLDSLLRARLHHLRLLDRRCLAVLALADRVDHVDRQLLGSLGLAGRVASLIDSGLMDEDDGQLYAAEPLLAEVALAGLSTVEHDRLRTALATLFAARAGGAASAASLRLDAGQHLLPAALATALRQALSNDLLPVAEQIAAAAGDGPHPCEVAILLMRTAAMGDQWLLAEHWKRAALDGVDERTRELALAAWAEVNFECRSDPGEEMAQLPAGRAPPHRATEVTDRVEASILRARLFTQDLLPMIRDGKRFLDEDPAPTAATQVRCDIATARSHFGTLRESQRLIEHELNNADLSPLERLRLQVVRGMTLAWTRGPTHALEAASSLLAQTCQDENPEALPLVLLHRATIRHDAGRHSAAVDDLRAADSQERPIHRRRHQSMTAGVTASSLSLLPARAAELAAMLAQHDPATAEHWIDAPLLLLARSRADLARGLSPWPGLQAGLEHAVLRNSGLHELQLLRESAYRGRAVEVLGRTRQLAARAEATLSDLVCEEVAGLAADDANALHATALRLAELGASGLALDCVTAAAAAHTRAGLPGQILRCEILAAHLRRQLADQISIAQHTWSPVLSPREQDVVDLVVAGARDREVAQALFLSVRTVERHLHRVYSRVGVSGRHHLRRLVLDDVSGLGGPPSSDPWLSRATGPRHDL